MNPFKAYEYALVLSGEHKGHTVYILGTDASGLCFVRCTHEVPNADHTTGRFESIHFTIMAASLQKVAG